MQISVCAATLTKLYVAISSYLSLVLPTAISGSYSGVINTLLAVQLTGTDVDGTVNYFKLNSLPSHGTLWRDTGKTLSVATGINYTVTGNGSLTLYFDPTNDYFGTDSFAFVAVDDDLQSSVAATASITIPDSIIPVAVSASYTGEQDNVLTIVITGTDNAAVANFTLSSLPTHGTLYMDIGLTSPAIISTNYAAVTNALTLYFSPTASFNGTDSFTFRVLDAANNSSALGTASLTVTPPAAPSASVTISSGNSINSSVTFNFAAPYPTVGQYANGDWWAAPSSGASVIISSITPLTTECFNMTVSANTLPADSGSTSTAAGNTISGNSSGATAYITAVASSLTVRICNVVGTFQAGEGLTAVIAGTAYTATLGSIASRNGYRNGSCINPQSTSNHCFDIDAAGGYTTAGTLLTFPLTVTPVAGSPQQIVKAVSVKPRNTARPALTFACVLTIVDTPITSSSTKFRPGYFGNPATKTSFLTTDINFANLPSFTQSSAQIASSSTFSLQKVYDQFRNVWMDHMASGTSVANVEDIRPVENMAPVTSGFDTSTNKTYMSVVVSCISAGAIRLMLDDFNYSNATHKAALHAYLQMCIDYKSMVDGGTTWGPNGGHGPGRKLPLLFGARLLGSSFTTSVATHQASRQFAEDAMTYVGTGAGVALFGQSGTDAAYWQTTRGLGGNRTVRDPYGYIDGGGYEIGGAYQYCCTAHAFKHAAFAARMLGGATVGITDATNPVVIAWNWPAFFEYVDRWRSFGVWASPDPAAPYDGVSGNYGITYGPDSTPPPAYIAGAGRWPTRHGSSADGSTYSNTFCQQAITYYENFLNTVFVDPPPAPEVPVAPFPTTHEVIVTRSLGDSWITSGYATMDRGINGVYIQDVAVDRVRTMGSTCTINSGAGVTRTLHDSWVQER